MPETSPRVQPRVAVEARVDRDAHPPRRPIPTGRTERLGGLPWHLRASLALLVVAWLALPLAGFLGPLLGVPWGLGLLGLSISSLVASILLGAE